MKRRLLIILAVVAGLGAAAAAVLIVTLAHGVTVRIPESTIRSAVESRFPQTRTYLLVLAVRYHDPRVALAGRDRVQVGISATPQIVVGGKEWTGTIRVDAGIRYDPPTGECFLTGFKVLEARIEGLPESRHLEVANRCIAMCEDVFAKHPVYTLDDGGFRQRTAKMLVKGIRITGGAVEISLGL